MENATKALIMAAVLLISVVILSLAVYLFAYLGSYAKGVEDQNKENQISQFNSQFLSYEGKDLTIYDVITIANMAKDYNEANGFVQSDADTSAGYIKVTGPTGISEITSTPFDKNHKNDISKIDNDHIGKHIKDENDLTIYVLNTYKCTVTVDNNTKTVNQIKFTP